MNPFQLAMGLAGLALIAWGLIILIYTLIWPHAPMLMVVGWAGRWVVTLAGAVAVAAALIKGADLAAAPALAVGLIVFVPGGIALKWLPVDVLAK